MSMRLRDMDDKTIRPAESIKPSTVLDVSEASRGAATPKQQETTESVE